MSIATPDLETLYYAFEWVVRIGALLVVPLRRKPAATTGWLLLIFFLPLAGLLLFLAIGRPQFPAWRTQRFRALLPYFDQVAAQLRQSAPADPGQQAPLTTLTETLGHMPATGGNHVELIDDYDGVITRLVADIERARHDVSILVYIFADDATGSA